MTARLEPCERKVTCPVCFAQPGYACRGGRGILTEPHRQRGREYAAQLTERATTRRQPSSQTAGRR